MDIAAVGDVVATFDGVVIIVGVPYLVVAVDGVCFLGAPDPEVLAVYLVVVVADVADVAVTADYGIDRGIALP